MPDNIFDKILFLSDTKIIITENNVIDGNLLLQSDVIDFIQVIDSLKTKKKINICNRVWNGYGKYTSISSLSCDTDCENIKCDRFENYSKYLRNKQIVGIV